MSAMGLLPEPGSKLLLVEDEPTQRLLIARKLRGVGYTVDMAENGTDPLLGIFNRRYLHEHLPQETSRARRYGEPLSLVMADLDHFKKVNDTYGHHTGDLVLQHAVNLARSALRVSDWIARYGGEEFVIVLPETPILGAYAVAERMRRLCAETPVKGLDSRLLVTASFGVATIDAVAPSPEDADAILREADKALYESKRAGRNRVTCGPKCVPQRESRPLVAANNSERVSANASQTDR